MCAGIWNHRGTWTPGQTGPEKTPDQEAHEEVCANENGDVTYCQGQDDYEHGDWRETCHGKRGTCAGTWDSDGGYDPEKLEQDGRSRSARAEPTNSDFDGTCIPV